VPPWAGGPWDHAWDPSEPNHFGTKKGKKGPPYSKDSFGKKDFKNSKGKNVDENVDKKGVDAKSSNSSISGGGDNKKGPQLGPKKGPSTATGGDNNKSGTGSNSIPLGGGGGKGGAALEGPSTSSSSTTSAAAGTTSAGPPGGGSANDNTGGAAANNSSSGGNTAGASSQEPGKGPNGGPGPQGGPTKYPAPILRLEGQRDRLRKRIAQLTAVIDGRCGHKGRKRLTGQTDAPTAALKKACVREVAEAKEKLKLVSDKLREYKIRIGEAKPKEDKKAKFDRPLPPEKLAEKIAKMEATGMLPDEVKEVQLKMQNLPEDADRDKVQHFLTQIMNFL